MLKLYFGHLLRRTDSFEKTLEDGRSSKHEVEERMTVLSPGSVRPLPAMLGAGVVKLLSPFPVERGTKWEGLCITRLCIGPRGRLISKLRLSLSPFFSWKD